MDWIERTVANCLTNLYSEAALADPWARQAARLRILQGLSQSRRLSRKKIQEVRSIFQMELDEYIANGSFGPRRPTWDPDGRESIRYHYSRLLALSVAIELASDRSSSSVATAIREESTALCESYFRWCDHITSVWGGSIHRAAP
jgi:hypothetical protein